MITWYRLPRSDNGMLIIADANLNPVAYIAENADEMAHWRKIATVPDMLEALHNALNILKTFGDNSGCVEQIEVVIARGTASQTDNPVR